MKDLTPAFTDAIKTACAEKQILKIQGGCSKRNLQKIDPSHTILSTTDHTGIISYEPTELVITVRCGTTLLEVLDTVGKNKQILSFEPPILSESATVGGSIATGFCGPNRPWGGDVSDSVLGIKLINGLGEVLQFGGQVFKNVAGFDLFRLQVGAWGQLGLLSEVSLRLNPTPVVQVFKQCPLAVDEAHALMIEWQQKPYPISGLVWMNNVLYLRLFGRKSAIDDCLEKINILDWQDASADVFYQLRDFNLPWMDEADHTNLYRISAPPSAKLRMQADEQLILDWGGAIRWLRTKAPTEEIFSYAARIGGFALLWSNPLSQQPLSPGAKLLHQSIKNAFDPNDIFAAAFNFN